MILSESGERTPPSCRIGVLEGDGIGAEVVPAAVRVTEAALTAVGAAVQWLPLPLGRSAIEEYGSAVPDLTLHLLADLDGWLLGPHDSSNYPEPHRSRLNPSGTIRKHFDLYANVRPARAMSARTALARGLDVVVVRENTQGFYADRSMHAGGGEFMPTADTAITIGVFTRAAVSRIARVALDLARARRGRLTIVHKANVLPMSSGLFRDVCREVAVAYPDVVVDEAHIDAMLVHLLRRGDEYDVIVAENMFGDILSELTAELAGSLGAAGSVNLSDDMAMGQAAHGAAPDIAGKNVANPVGMILSAALLLRTIGQRREQEELVAAAAAIESAVSWTVAKGAVTADAGGTLSTRAVTDEVIAAVRAQAGAGEHGHEAEAANGHLPGGIDPTGAGGRGGAAGQGPAESDRDAGEPGGPEGGADRSREAAGEREPVSPEA
jgi:3-isopropylmalate dehydrogenase